MTSTTITNRNGLKFNVQLTADAQGHALVKFYDDRFKTKGFHPTLGQFVSAYYATTLAKDANNLERRGLCLDGGVDDWRVDADQMQAVMRFINSN